LSERVLLGEFRAGTTILVGLDAENDELTFEAVAPPEPTDPTATPQPEMAGQD
jgi:hypothetical protein